MLYRGIVSIVGFGGTVAILGMGNYTIWIIGILSGALVSYDHKAGGLNGEGLSDDSTNIDEE